MKMLNSHQRTREHAAFFRALGHPIRLGIVELLARRPLNVCQLQAVFGTNLSNISRHLSVLRGVGLVVGGRYGVEVRYRLQSDVVAGFQQQLDEVMGVPHGPSMPPAGKLRAALEHRPPPRPR
jgi:DNA-binding transcriptional ArsR family regulator